jgi:hypothetical protein
LHQTGCTGTAVAEYRSHFKNFGVVHNLPNVMAITKIHFSPAVDEQM